MEKLLIIGAGGYAKSVLDSIDYYNYQVAGFIDEFSRKKDHLAYPILARSIDEIKDCDEYFYFIAIGNNFHRRRWYDALVKRQLRLINVVDRSAIVSQRATIGKGCFIGKMAIVNSMSVVCDNCIVNSKALIEHGCYLSEHANISTNSVINGDVHVGEGSFLGSCSVTRGQLQIGKWSTVGAGAVVVSNVPDGKIVAGIPARIIKDNEHEEDGEIYI